jgi:hypothetical protein
LVSTDAVVVLCTESALGVCERDLSHYELGVDVRAHRRVAAAFTELARAI